MEREAVRREPAAMATPSDPSRAETERVVVRTGSLDEDSKLGANGSRRPKGRAWRRATQRRYGVVLELRQRGLQGMRGWPTTDVS